MAIARAGLPTRQRHSMMLGLQRHKKREFVQPMLVRFAKSLETRTALSYRFEQCSLPGTEVFEVDLVFWELRCSCQRGRIQAALFDQSLQADEQRVTGPRRKALVRGIAKT